MGLFFLKLLREKFFLKMYVLFTICIFFISVSFTFYFIRVQSKSFTDALIDRGNLLTKILAHNAIIGVFSENSDLLVDPVTGIFQIKDVVEVCVMNLKGNVLTKRKKNAVKKDMDTTPPENCIYGKEAYFKEKKNIFCFWSPVVIDSDFPSSDALLFSDNAKSAAKKAIGYVNVTLDKTILKKQTARLVINALFIGSVFLVLGSIVSFLFARGITKPLNLLTKDVQKIEKGKSVNRITVKVTDEIGRLAQAFNNMYDALRKREQALKNSEETLRFLSTRLIKAQEDERKRLSFELHDELGQSLAILKHKTRSIEKKIHTDSDQAIEACKQIIAFIDQIIDNVRRLSRDLSPSILEHLGFTAALNGIIESYESQQTIEINCSVENIDPLLSKDAQTHLYRIAQEILTNIDKHAKATHVNFTIETQRNNIFITVEDNGKGFNLEKTKNMSIEKRGIGLTALNERINMLGGHLSIVSIEGQGTRIAIRIPT